MLAVVVKRDSRRLCKNLDHDGAVLVAGADGLEKPSRAERLFVVDVFKLWNVDASAEVRDRSSCRRVVLAHLAQLWWVGKGNADGSGGLSN